MTTEIEITRSTVRAYHQARNSGDLDAASSYLAPDFFFESPMMHFENAAEYLASHHAFQALITGMDMISELYAMDEATWIYDLRTATPAGVQRTAEHFKLRAGKISSVHLIFDATPWMPLMSRLKAPHGSKP